MQTQIKGLSEDIQLELDQTIMALGFQSWNFIPLHEPYSIDKYRQWIDKQYHGSMNYLETHFENKKRPQNLKPNLHSALVLTHSYVPHPFPLEPYPKTKIARYAQGQDYHHWLKHKCDLICELLSRQFPEASFYSFTDSAPVLERDLAARANLGWVGKNTCLIDRKHGSFFLIAEIYSSLKVETELAIPKDFCGNCNRCIEACPTQALEPDRVLNATKCISYLNIESRENPTPELRDKMQDLFFGCDICQSVCPWNQKVLKSQFTETDTATNITSYSSHLSNSLKEILESSGKAIERKTLGSPLRRAGAYGLKRNALIVAGNLKLQELQGSILKLKAHPKLGELAEWALEKIQSP